VNNFLQMAQIGSDANVSIVVQFDRIGGYDTRYEDWTDCLRFYVEYGMTPTLANAMADMGEVNMADRSTLESFLAWGTHTYQAERYIVVLKDHGCSWMGCCQDETSGGDLLDLRETSFALRAMVNITGAPIDLLVFDDCLMGSVEVATEFKDLALYAVVSETLGWTSNHDYASILSFLTSSPQMSSRSAAIGLTERMHLVDNTSLVTQCVAAYDLQRTDVLLSALNVYLTDLYECWQADPGNIQLARIYSDSFTVSHELDTIDLYQFIVNTMVFCDDHDLNVSAQVVLDMIDGSAADPLVLLSRTTATAEFCHGMSAYFPLNYDGYNLGYQVSGVFADDNIWAGMISSYVTSSPPLTFLYLSGAEGDNGWYISAVDAEFACYDPTSQGIDVLECSYGGAWFECSGILNFTEDGKHTLFYRCTGMNGAVEKDRNASIWVDRTAPSVSTVVNDRTFSLSATDNTSGLRSIHYRIDGGSWIIYTGEVTVEKIGHQYLVEYYALDNAGNACLVGEIAVGEEDAQAPVTSLELHGTAGTNDWFTGDVQVILSADDGNGVGVSSISYQIGEGEWQLYSRPLWFNETGKYVLKYRSEDAVGNVDIVRTAEVKVDEIAPTAMIEVRDPDHGVWYNHSVPVTFAGNDVGSGLHAVQYRLNGGSWNSADAFTYTTEAISLLEWRAVDNAGNYGEIGSMTLRLDTQGSFVTINVGGFDEDGWTNRSVTMDFLAFKIGPANNTIYMRVNEGDWVAVGDRASFNESGEYHVEARSVDEANNTGYPTTSVHFYVDRVLPVSVLNVTGLSDSPNVYLNSVTIDIEGTDEGKGLDRCMYRLGNGTWREIAAPFSLTQAGNYTLEY
ncbi:MAG: hypothetical protein JET69_05870, partial [Methanomassiliicoccales archaeon]|nr:hypothetical protein [Methanomassiliicoccales archaeon]